MHFDTLEDNVLGKDLMELSEITSHLWVDHTHRWFIIYVYLTPKRREAENRAMVAAS